VNSDISISTEKTVKAAIFDLGNVVIRIDAYQIPIRLARLTGGDPLQIGQRLLADPWCTRLEAGEVSAEDFHRHITQTIGLMSYQDFLQAWNSIFFGLVDGIVPLLLEVRKHLRLVALTNTNAPHAQCWQSLYPQAMAPFERVFMSHEMGARKPDPRIYQAVLDHLRLPAEQVVFVDDTLGHVQAAIELGMAGILAQSPAQIAQALRELGVPLEK
jgi:putative hydrolase of the HAD superfamily